MFVNNPSQQPRANAGGFIIPVPSNPTGNYNRPQAFRSQNSYPGLAQSALYPVLPSFAPVAAHPYPNMAQQTYPGTNPYPPAASEYPIPQAPYPQGEGYPTTNYPSGMGYPTPQSPPSTAHLPMAQPQTGNHPESIHYQLTVACKNLANKDVFSKSDPVCILSELQGNRWVEIGRTEKIKDNLNPSWLTKFYVKKRQGQNTQLRFEVYDWDCKSNNLKKHDFLGRQDVALDTILKAPGMQYVTIIKEGPSKKGQFVITSEKLTTDKTVVKIQLGARNLDKKDTFGKSDPYFIINKITGHGKLTPVHQSEVIMNTLSPTWSPFSISIRKLCNGDYDCRLQFDIYDYDKNSQPDLIGSFSTTVNELKGALAANRIFHVINDKKQSKRNYRNSGEVFVKDFTVWEAQDFQDAM